MNPGDFFVALGNAAVAADAVDECDTAAVTAEHFELLKARMALAAIHLIDMCEQNAEELRDLVGQMARV